MRLQIQLIIVSLSLTCLTIVSTQESSLFTPQKEHKILEKFAGEWDFEKHSVPENGEEPEIVSKGIISAELVGGFFVVNHWSGELYGAEFKAFQSLGYDIEKKKYTGTWFDSTMNYKWELNGIINEENQEMIITASGPGPTGGTTTFRERYKFNSSDSITIIGEIQKEEKWLPFVTTKLKKKS